MTLVFWLAHIGSYRSEIQQPMRATTVAGSRPHTD